MAPIATVVSATVSNCFLICCNFIGLSYLLYKIGMFGLTFSLVEVADNLSDNLHLDVVQFQGMLSLVEADACHLVAIG